MAKGQDMMGAVKDYGATMGRKAQSGMAHVNDLASQASGGRLRPNPGRVGMAAPNMGPPTISPM
jgi:hypothetical protein